MYKVGPEREPNVLHLRKHLRIEDTQSLVFKKKWKLPYYFPWLSKYNMLIVNISSIQKSMPFWKLLENHHTTIYDLGIGSKVKILNKSIGHVECKGPCGERPPQEGSYMSWVWLRQQRGLQRVWTKRRVWSGFHCREGLKHLRPQRMGPAWQEC